MQSNITTFTNDEAIVRLEEISKYLTNIQNKTNGCTFDQFHSLYGEHLARIVRDDRGFFAPKTFADIHYNIEQLVQAELASIEQLVQAELARFKKIEMSNDCFKIIEDAIAVQKDRQQRVLSYFLPGNLKAKEINEHYNKAFEKIYDSIQKLAKDELEAFKNEIINNINDAQNIKNLVAIGKRIQEGIQAHQEKQQRILSYFPVNSKKAYEINKHYNKVFNEIKEAIKEIDHSIQLRIQKLAKDELEAFKNKSINEINTAQNINNLVATGKEIQDEMQAHQKTHKRIICYFLPVGSNKAYGINKLYRDAFDAISKQFNQMLDSKKKTSWLSYKNLDYFLVAILSFIAALTYILCSQQVVQNSI